MSYVHAFSRMKLEALSFPTLVRRTMELVVLKRKSRLLKPSRLPCLGSIPTLRLASGCTHGCLDCFAQGSCGQIASEKMAVADNFLNKLGEELARRRQRPAAVCFDFSSDPFQPMPQALDQTYEVLEFLLGEGVGVVFQTKAKIPQRHLDLLLAHATLVRAVISLSTIDRRLLRIFEPRTATPGSRLAQMRKLVAGGVATLARIDPILPGITDDPDALHGLCAALARAGVREAAAGMLVLRPARIAALRNRLGRPKIFGRMMRAFPQGGGQPLCEGSPAVCIVAAARRRRIFQWLTTIAAQYGIRVHVCACRNPDLASESCKLAGAWSPIEIVERQLALFS